MPFISTPPSSAFESSKNVEQPHESWRSIGLRAGNTSSVSSRVQLFLSRARAGDKDALGALLERQRSELLLLARLQVGMRLQGKVDGADLVQETFLEAHRDFAQFRGTTEREFVAWLRRILASNLANLIRHYFRTQRRDMNLERELVDSMNESSRVADRGFVARQETPSQDAAKREQAVLLSHALKGLNDDYRTVIVLRHIEGLSFPDVSQRMGRSEDSVKKLWARALARLKKALRSPDSSLSSAS